MTAAAELPHLIREPAGEPQGALVLLHGRGTSEADLHPLLEALDPERRLLGVTPGAPITNLPPGGRHWYVIERVGHPDERTFVETLSLLSGFVDELLREREVPWDHTVVGGFSQGGAVSLALALGAGRPRAAGILAMSCFLPLVRGRPLDIPQKRGMPVHLSHGAYDPIIPVELGRRARDLLTEGGLDVTYRETRAQHSIDPALLPEMRSWLLARTGGGTPTRQPGPGGG